MSQRLDPKIPSAHLKWDVPRGTNEFGKSLKDTLAREVKEETWLNVNIISRLPECVSKEWCHEDYLQHTLVFCYYCRLIDGIIHLNDPKIRDLKWMLPNDAQKHDLLSTTKVFIDLFNNNQIWLKTFL